MKKYVLLIWVLFFAVQGFAQKADWYLDRQSVYPHKDWITAEGRGENEEKAKENALENISLYFQTSTNVVIKAIENYNEASVANNKLVTGNKSLKKSTTITSTAEFFGIQFTTPIYDDKTIILAYINRDDVFKVYEQRIRNNVDVLKALMTVAEDWNNPVYGIRAAEIAKPIIDLTAEEARMARLIKNVPDDYFTDVDDLVKRVNVALEFCKTHLVFKISVKNDYENMLKQALGDILEDAGYEVSDENGYLTIDAKVTSDVEKNDAGIFIYAGFAVTLKTHDGKDFFSYSRNMPKKGHKSESMAYKRAFQSIQTELESSFMEEFNAKLK